MSNRVHQLDSSIFIRHVDFDAVMEAINLLMEDAVEEPYGMFKGVDTSSVINAANLTEQLTEWLWKPKYDSHGNIVGLLFQGKEYGDESRLFQAIAPYVKENSYVTLQDACDGETRQWVFNGTTCEEKIIVNN